MERAIEGMEVGTTHKITVLDVGSIYANYVDNGKIME